ncbi:hypothetical protein KBK19_12780 [Microvirga sp. STR05]|uniref:Uncharacterized protein n=1 Tax=Hymenobacter duratus TaxID=2771356 RepID=A0ABR8JGB5_9BACT|nr:hypothetical protein [Hymenobacter duratus]MBD2715909.1 hypothetical protein [Hymenobacter duratus]MBR7950823.1 hypothetical protein [Microvirga sp. STR05]
MFRIPTLRRVAPLLSVLGVAAACSKDDDQSATPETGTFEKTVRLPADYYPPTDVAELTDGSVFVLRQARPQVNGYVASFTTTRDGKRLLCSGEAGRLVLRKTNADLTD